jgi:hypothetical protein
MPRNSQSGQPTETPSEEAQSTYPIEQPTEAPNDKTRFPASPLTEQRATHEQPKYFMAEHPVPSQVHTMSDRKYFHEQP